MLRLKSLRRGLCVASRSPEIGVGDHGMTWIHGRGGGSLHRLDPKTVWARMELHLERGPRMSRAGAEPATEQVG